MAIEPQFCANKNCIKHTEHRGGVFRFKVATRETFCEDCFRPAVQLDGCRELYDIVTTHVNGERMHIRGKAQMREVEKKYGVSHHISNNDQKNWGPPSAKTI